MPVEFDWPSDERYARFVTEHAQTLARLALLLTGNRFDAEDVVQDAVIAVAARWAKLRRETALAYLRTAVTNRALDLVRRRKWTVSRELVIDEGVAESGYLKFESDIELARMLQELPERQRAVLVLRFCLQLDDTTVGRMLGCTAATVRSQASRGLARLRTQLVPAPARPAASTGSSSGSSGGGIGGPEAAA